MQKERREASSPGLLRFHSAHSPGQIRQKTSNTVGRGLLVHLTLSRVRERADLCDVRTLTVWESADVKIRPRYDQGLARYVYQKFDLPTHADGGVLCGHGSSPMSGGGAGLAALSRAQ